MREVRATASVPLVADFAMGDGVPCAPLIYTTSGDLYALLSGVVTKINGGGVGSGDVVGPASSTDGDVALFDGATGKKIKDGGSLANSKIANVCAVFDGGGSTPTVGTKVYVVAPYACTITGWDISADVAGSAVIDVWKASGTIPSVANTIAGAEKPTLSAAQLNSDTSLTTWTTTVSVGDVFGFNLDSVATCTRVTAQLRITKT